MPIDGLRGIIVAADCIAIRGEFAENKAETDLPGSICKTERGMSIAEQQSAAEIRSREILQPTVALA
jgi:hypothetical protein